MYSSEKAFSHSLLGGVRRQLNGEEACVANLGVYYTEGKGRGSETTMGVARTVSSTVDSIIKRQFPFRRNDHDRNHVM